MNKMEEMLDSLEKWSRESNEQNSPAVAIVIMAKVYDGNIKTKAGVLGDTGLGREVVEIWLDDETRLGDFFRECYEDRLQKDFRRFYKSMEDNAWKLKEVRNETLFP